MCKTPVAGGNGVSTRDLKKAVWLEQREPEGASRVWGEAGGGGGAGPDCSAS